MLRYEHVVICETVKIWQANQDFPSATLNRLAFKTELPYLPGPLFIEHKVSNVTHVGLTDLLPEV